MKIITIANLRGGPGKTTTSLYFAKILSAIFKKHTLLVDLDPQVSVGIRLNMEMEKISKNNIMKALSSRKLLKKCIYNYSENFDVLPSYADLENFDTVFGHVISAELLVKDLIRDLDYDYVIIDTRPAYSLITKNGIMAADALLIPINTDSLSVEGAIRIVNNIDDIKETSPARKEINISKYYILPTQQRKFMASFSKEILQKINHSFGGFEDIKILEPISYFEKLADKQAHFKFMDGKIMNEYKKAVEAVING